MIEHSFKGYGNYPWGREMHLPFFKTVCCLFNEKWVEKSIGVNKNKMVLRDNRRA